MRETEHFCTLLDHRFLPQGLALFRSLQKWARPFHLSALCMDAEAEEALRGLGEDELAPVPLAAVETPELLGVKPGRTRAEYCWTLASHFLAREAARQTPGGRATYLDADLFFFADPRQLIEEMEQSRKGILITEHAYDPRYDTSSRHGRFCVQFVTCVNQPAARLVVDEWKNQCREWCFSRYDRPGCFGDQMYLDAWPGRHGEVVHVARQVERTLAPWNVDHFLRRRRGALAPVFFHFHNFRILSRARARLFVYYRVGGEAVRRYYAPYLGMLRDILRDLEARGLPFDYALPPAEKWARLRDAKRRLFGEVAYGRIG